MSWICVGCKQVQETKEAFAPVINHTHYVEGVAPAGEPQTPPVEEKDPNEDLTS